jgi:thiol:disulfide interchange protein DsbD
MLYHFLHNLETIFNSSPGLGLGASFLAGVLVSFSPCIFPLIPITLGVVGATAVNSRAKGFLTSAVFVLGIAVIYTILGVAAALFNVVLEKFFVNPVTYIFLGLFFFAMGLSLLGVIKINFFSFTHNYAHKPTYPSIFVLGLISGLSIIPCNFPVLGSILTLISLKKDVAYGALALLLFSLGYGSILIILGTFTSLIAKLPKRNKIVIIIHKFVGIVMLLVGVYFFLKFISMNGGI